MEKFRTVLSKLPPWLLTVVTGVLIIWLTLMPDPLGDNSPTLFPGADKVVHAIMFGFLTCMILLDGQRRQHWLPVSPLSVAGAAAVSTIGGVLIEFAQLEMDMGRGFETADMLADFVGSAIAALAWILCQKYWCR